MLAVACPRSPLLVVGVLATVAVAEGAEADQDAVTSRGKPEEIIVYGDPFARWDGTRWAVSAQIGMPVPYTLFAKLNKEIESVAVDMALVLACEKTWRRGKARHEVDCSIEDIGLRSASWKLQEPNAQAVLAEMDARLTGARLQLLVADDGRLMNIDLEGVEGDNDREKAIREQARMLLVRAMVGFHMKLPPRNQIREGQWLEYDTQLFAIPIAPGGPRREAAATSDAAGDGVAALGSARAAIVVNSLGGSYVLHQLDRYKGHLVVQSVGEGTILVGDDDTGDESFFKVRLDGVAIYGEDTGIMTERVWTMAGRTTAGSFLGDGRADAFYFHNGRIRMLDEDAKFDVGPTGPVARPGQTQLDLPAWKALE